MSKFKAEVIVDLIYDSLCYGCCFYDYMGGNFHECSATNTAADTRWEAENCNRPMWCPLQKVEE
jgi:hypothetical protein